MKKRSFVGLVLMLGVLVAYTSLWSPGQRVTSAGSEPELTESAGRALTETRPAARVKNNEDRGVAAAPGAIERIAAARRRSSLVQPLRLTPIPTGVPLDALRRPQAMPGFGGFDLPPTFSETVARLKSEGIDSNWSSETEARILAETSSLTDQAVVSIQTECRTTLCGLLIVHSRPDVQFKLPNWESLGDRLDVQHPLMHTGFAQDGTRFTAIYFGRNPQ